MALKHLVALVGGVGGAKLAHGLAQVVPPESLTIIINTGDDFWHYGLKICPDLDTVMYTLSGLVDKGNGWGIAGDTINTLDALRRFGEEPWFRLGDQDIATHLLRTQALRSGERLTTITQRLTKRLGVAPDVLPMTDSEISTMIDTAEYGELEFQVYFVRYRWQPTVTGIRFAGAEDATMSAEVEAALTRADAILIAPSNPFLSVAPFLSIPGLRDLIISRDVPRVAISPIVAGAAVKGPAAKLMAELKYPVSPTAVAEYYGDLINGFIYDVQDAAHTVPQRNQLVTNTLMHTDADRGALALKILEWIESEGFTL
ncbi:2-phospho-L-lactate transferase [Anaerolineae bacterium CFX9]|nr:2-phospho-L-lactate transferase [Anaerolineae bacterium CFX9]